MTAIPELGRLTPAQLQHLHNNLELGREWAFEAFRRRRTETRRRTLRRPPTTPDPMYPPELPMLGPRIIAGARIGLLWRVAIDLPAVIGDLPLP